MPTGVETKKVKQVWPVAKSDYLTQSVRPANSVRDCHCFESTFGFRVEPCREPLVRVIGKKVEVGVLAQQEMGYSGVMR